MSVVDRRSFLGLTFGGMAAASFGLGGSTGASSLLWAKEKSSTLDNVGVETLFLTWQRDPTTTITIQWIAPAAQNPPGIEYRPTAGMLWQTAKTHTKPFPGTDLNVYRCELAGLIPGTEYSFQIGGKSQEYRCRTMPAKATDEFWFVSGGDAGANDAAIASNQLAAKQDPYFVLLGGDLAYDNGKAPDVFVRFLQNYHRTMVDSQGRLIPLVSCIGNHEVDTKFPHQRTGAGNYLSVFDGLFAENSYNVLDFGDYLSLVLLDTNHLAPIAGEQTSWLARVLAEREDHPHVFAVNHVPAYPSFRDPWGKDNKGHTGEDQRKHWSPLFERHKVNVVLEHHDHAFKRSHPLTDGRVDERAGVLYLGDGSWGKIRAPKSPEDRPYLAKTSESFHVSLHRIEGERRFHIALTGTGKVADVITTVKNRASI